MVRYRLWTTTGEYEVEELQVRTVDHHCYFDTILEDGSEYNTTELFLDKKNTQLQHDGDSIDVISYRGGFEEEAKQKILDYTEKKKEDWAREKQRVDEEYHAAVALNVRARAL